MKEKLLDKFWGLYLWPAIWVCDRVCTGGPSGLPFLLIAMVIVPPIFWLTVMAAIVSVIAVVV